MPMARITLNGMEHELGTSTSIAALLEANGFAERKVAVEVNCEIVPKSMHSQRLLRDGDRLEIVHAIGGG
jgi:sulfur carrier protein